MTDSLKARIERMMNEVRPDRYEVDENGFHPWMDEVADRIAADPTITVEDLKRVSRHGIIERLFADAGVEGGDVDR